MSYKPNIISNVEKPDLFWNLRGRAISVYEKKKISDLIKRGFIRCENGVHPGDYNPIYDKGDSSNTRVLSRKINAPSHGGKYLKLIEV